MSTQVLCVFRLGIAIAVLAVMTSTVRAENGAIAYAQPLADLQIDGDLGDWPDSAERYPIARPLESFDWRDDAYFQVAYAPDGNALYVAVVTTDAVPTGGDGDRYDWQQFDAHLLYVDTVHSPRGSAGWFFAATTNGVANLSDTEGWDPAAVRASESRVEVAVSHSDGQTVYEWRIDADRPLTPGMSIGLDHVLIDTDGEDNDRGIGSWGRFSGKSQRAGRLGDVVLLGEQSTMGTLTGRLRWDSTVTDDDIAGERVRITALGHPELWLNVESDDAGEYRIDLPEGRYCVTPAFPLQGQGARYRVADEVEVCQTVVADAVAEAPELVWTPTPRPVERVPEPGLLFRFDDAAARRLDAFMQENLEHFFVPGASVAIINDGRVVYRREYGVANWLTNTPVRHDHLFDVGSITKPVFAFAVHRLADRGLIDLDRPLHEYQPFDDIADDPRSKLFTARQVLSHRTGLPNWRWQNDSGELDIAFTPGDGFRYSGEGYDYLGRVVEQLTGETLAQVLRREAAEPLGIGQSARFTQSGNWHDLFVTGHSERRAFANQAPTEAHAAYSLNATARDLANVLITWMNRGGGLSEAGYAAMFEQLVSTGDTAGGTDWEQHYGAGPSLYDTPYGRAIGHGGLNWGQVAQMEFYEDHDDGFVVVTNGEEGWRLRDALRQFLVAGLQPDD
ncbi:MAG: serine hydrolase [Pseudomonadota bacterium]